MKQAGKKQNIIAAVLGVAHGGVLKEGTYARITHSDGQILRIDIRKEGSD